MDRSRNQRLGGVGDGVVYLLALRAANKFMQLPRKPPVTIFLILVNAVVYLRPGVVDVIFPTLEEVCLCPYLVLKDWDAKRLFLSAFYHTDIAHLVFNMMSLLSQGVQLENNVGGARFAGIVALLLVMSHGLEVLSAKLLATFSTTFAPMYSQCAAGFSGVLFALQIILTWNSSGHIELFGVAVPAKYAAWTDLLLVQVLVPRASFLGHLCGIVAGLIYVNFGWLSGGSFSPFVWVKRVIQVVVSLFSLLFAWRRRGSFQGRGRTTGTRHLSRMWRCSVCAFDNAGSRAACETCSSPKGDSPNSPPQEIDPTAPPWPEEQKWSPAVEELRRARLARFNPKDGGR